MSDLEDDSDIEQDADAEIESDKEDKDIGLTKPGPVKKHKPEYDSEEEDDALDDTDDDDDDVTDDFPIDESDSLLDDKTVEFGQFDDKGETSTALSPIDSEIDSEEICIALVLILESTNFFPRDSPSESICKKTSS